MSKKRPKLTKAQVEINLTATNLANKEARRSLLDDPALAERLRKLTKQSLTILRRSWAPFRPDHNTISGFGMQLHVYDPLVRDLLREVGLIEKAEHIAVTSMKESMTIHARPFISTLLDDLILNPDSHYTKYVS